jgi:hypothetical protein
MSMFVSYRNVDASDGVGGEGEFQYVKFGALINF